MRFKSLSIRNLRAIREFSVSGLNDLVLIAGPNGCGKSCILDAIRLLKSGYGGYQSNEWMQWFGEFQVNLQDPRTLRNIFRDPDEPIHISAEIELSPAERGFLAESASRICEPLVWAEVTRSPGEMFQYSPIAYAAAFPDLVPVVAQQTMQVAANLIEDCQRPSHHISLSLSSSGAMQTGQSLTARVIFQSYDPDNLGLIEFHSASRTYFREALGGVNLDVRAIENQRRSQRLYNWQGKYQNVKAEIATMFLRALVAKDAGVELPPGSDDLDATLKELFRTFFPDKEYLGVQTAPDGSISFPVRLATGEQHDINELSSGEKEVVYGYLRLQGATPAHSTILYDEPELHLNPGLLQGFPDFYYRHISLARESQLWLVTHSDALLREAVDNPNFSVIHMTSASASVPGTNQAIVVGEDDLDAALLDLVGDLAAYRPTGKVVILEGGGDSEFDTSVIRRLFPQFAAKVNLISGGSKGRVKSIYDTLQRTAVETGVADRFFAVVDRDSGLDSNEVPDAHVLAWNVYHIENYLLEPRFVLSAYRAVSPSPVLSTAEEVEAALRSCAEDNLMRLVLIRLRDRIDRDLFGALSIGASPDSSSPAEDLGPSIAASFGRLDALKKSVGDPATVSSWQAEIEMELRGMVGSDSWKVDFPGRTILKAFVDRFFSGGMSYQHFVTLIVNQMVASGYQPLGMKSVLQNIAAVDDSAAPLQPAPAGA